MTARSPDPARVRRSRGRIRLAVLLAILAALVAYLAIPGSGPATGAACVGNAGAPEVTAAGAGEISGLRDDVARLVPQRVARLYEEGTVRATSAWSDENPAPPPVTPGGRQPAGYEMRWWAPNGDDLVADELVFGSEAAAARFVRLAVSGRCRSDPATEAAATPPQASNLAWLNPEGVAQADVYLERHDRVFRVADAPSRQNGGHAGAGVLQQAFLTIDTLACLLPHAGCARGGSGAVAS